MQLGILTSSLVLSLLVAGSEAMAMDADNQENNGAIKVSQRGQQSHTQETLTQEDLLTQSMINPIHVQAMLKGYDQNATEEDKKAAAQAAKELTIAAQLRKQQKAKNSALEVEPLSNKDQEAVSWFARFLPSWFSSANETDKNTGPIISAGLEKEADEKAVNDTPVTPEEKPEKDKDSTITLSSVEVQFKTTEASSGSWNSFVWWFGSNTSEAKLEETKTTPEVVTSPEIVVSSEAPISSEVTINVIDSNAVAERT